MTQDSPQVSRNFPVPLQVCRFSPYSRAKHARGSKRLRRVTIRGGIDQAWRGIVRKLPAGLFSLALAATAGLGWATASNAATPPREMGAAPIASEAPPAPDELSSPQEDKRRDLRQEAL